MALRTPFHQFHLDHGAKLVDFAGWEMPLLYRSIHEEHRHVRAVGGLFDVSHMGRLRVAGRHARRLLERTLTRRVSDMAPGSCRYSLICNERGGVRDDVIIYRYEDHWLLVVNASNREKIVQHLRDQTGDLIVRIEDQTLCTGMLAVQGPKVMRLIGRFSTEVPTLKRYRFCVKNLLIVKLTISRTGYTGEDGVEVILPVNMVGMLVKLFFKEAPPDDPNHVPLLPAGLGARDTLRLEAGMPLYGHELDEDTDPLSAGLAFAVSLDKDQDENGERFVGQEALKRIAAEGTKRRLVGLKLEGKRTARQGMAVLTGDRPVGAVTSGCLSPTLGYPIAMAYVESGRGEPGTVLAVDLGAQHVPAEVVNLPFYKRA